MAVRYQLPLSLATDINRYGLVPGESILSFDGTNTITIAPVGTTRSYYRAGVKYTITGSKSVVLTGTPVATGLYYVFIDSTDGTITQPVGASAWTLNDTKVPVTTLYFNDSLTPKFVFTEERHTCLVDRRRHMEHHYIEGTQFVAGGAVLSGYTPNTPTDAGNTFGIASSNIFDEDLYLTLSTFTDDNGVNPVYFVPYRTSTTARSRQLSRMPFYFTGATAPYSFVYYDNAGTMTAGVANRYYNYYLFCSNARSSTEATQLTSTSASRYMLIPGRAQFTSQTLADAENPANFSLAGFPVAEGVFVYRITLYTGGGAGEANTVKGRCSINKVASVLANVTSTTVIGATNHNTLAGLDLAQAGVTYGHIDDQTQTIAGAKTFSSDVTVPDESYDATNRDASLEVPTKNALRDKIETLVPNTRTLTINGTGYDLSADRSRTVSGSASYRTAVPGSPTRTANTTFTVTDTSNTNKYDLLLSRGTCLKRTESSTLRQAMIVSATYATDTVTVTIIGDDMASIDSSSLKYGYEKAKPRKFALAGTIGATGTNVANTVMCEMPAKVYGADIRTDVAGNGTTTVDINKEGTTMFTTKPSITTTSKYGLGFTADTGSTVAVGEFITIDQDAVASTTKIIGEYVNVYRSPLYLTYYA